MFKTITSTLTTLQRLTFPVNYNVQGLEKESLLSDYEELGIQEFSARLYDELAEDMVGWIVEPVGPDGIRAKLVHLYLQPRFWVAKHCTVWINGLVAKYIVDSRDEMFEVPEVEVDRIIELFESSLR